MDEEVDILVSFVGTQDPNNTSNVYETKLHQSEPRLGIIHVSFNYETTYLIKESKTRDSLKYVFDTIVNFDDNFGILTNLVEKPKGNSNSRFDRKGYCVGPVLFGLLPLTHQKMYLNLGSPVLRIP